MADNRFRLRASEQAISDEQFLSFIGPDVLELLPKDQLWDRLLILESAPGGGKTTILRLFVPTALRLLERIGTQEEYRPLFSQLKGLGVLDAQGHPTVIGVIISCREQYATIQDVPLEESIQIRWYAYHWGSL